MLLLVHLVEHEVLLADAPHVRDGEVEGRRGVEAVGDDPEEDRHDLRDRLHLRVRRARRRTSPGGPGSGEPGIRINGLDKISVAGADHWMIKVQDTPISTVFVDTEFVGAGVRNYRGGDDIIVAKDQHIILVAVDTSNKIKAYKDITFTADKISAAAGTLVLDNNFKMPTYGATVGNTKIEQLVAGGFSTIDKWMVVTLSKTAVIPAMDISTTEYEKYTEGKTFSYYTENTDIAATVGEHLLLVGVDVIGTTNTIKAYVDLTIDGTAVRQANAPEIPDINFAAPEMGTTAGTTKIPNLNFTGDYNLHKRHYL